MPATAAAGRDDQRRVEDELAVCGRGQGGQGATVVLARRMGLAGDGDAAAPRGALARAGRGCGADGARRRLPRAIKTNWGVESARTWPDRKKCGLTCEYRGPIELNVLLPTALTTAPSRPPSPPRPPALSSSSPSHPHQPPWGLARGGLSTPSICATAPPKTLVLPLDHG